MTTSICASLFGCSATGTSPGLNLLAGSAGGKWRGDDVPLDYLEEASYHLLQDI
jgi:hypothetical protein